MTEDSKEVFGVVFDIQRFSLHDGPGIRTLVFLKGCPLRCMWCANPEGLTLDGPILQLHHKRKGGQYSGRMSAMDVIRTCERDGPFFINSEGGLTLGGGEPLFQYEFALEIFRLAKERNLNCAIETTAHAKTSAFLSAVSLCDTVFVDIKAVNDELHRKITGVSNRQILKNIKLMDEKLSDKEKQKVTLRIPLIPTCNADLSIIKEIGEFIKSLTGNYKIEILPFHNFGESKYEKLGLNYAFAGEGNMKEGDAVPYKELLSGMGLSVRINTH